MKKSIFVTLILFSTILLLSFIYAECEENWVCGTWTDCNLEGMKNRTCQELNHCNTTADKPDIKRQCGENCSIITKCRDWNPCVKGKQTRICYVANTCGNAEQSQIEWKYCEAPSPTINLSDNKNQTQNNTPIEETNEQEVNNSWCKGCVLESKCIDYGARLEYQNQSRYCDPIDSKIKTQKLRNAQGKLVACNQNYECKSNVCNKTCIDIGEIKEQLTTQVSLMSKFLCKIKTLFKPENYDACLFSKMNG